jgi:hypothetical protein
MKDYLELIEEQRKKMKGKNYVSVNLSILGMLLTGVMVIQDMHNILVLFSAPILFLAFAWIMFDELEKLKGGN